MTRIVYLALCAVLFLSLLSLLVKPVRPPKLTSVHHAICITEE